MEHVSTDVTAIWYHMERQHKDLSLKRLFLMGLSDIHSSNRNMRSHAEKLILPESFLRKDDVFYEDVENVVQKSFLASKPRQSIIDDEEEVNNISGCFLTLLDDLSNHGLWCLAKIVTKHSVFLDNTRPRMKRVIKHSLREVISNLSDSNSQCQLWNQLSQLLKNPKNFRQNHGRYIKKTRKSLLCALGKVDFQLIPVRVLCAMHRKLKGTQSFKMQLCPGDSGWRRDRLITRVIKLFKQMIKKHDESDQLQYSLAKAMAVPSLYSKIASNYQDLSMAKFVQMPPEVEALQNEIVKAIQTLDQRLKEEDLKNLQLLLDPKFKVNASGLRKAIRNLLIDCLFGCSDMEAVPDSLLKALSLINKKSYKTHRFSSKEIIEEEVEHILDVGAQIKQLVWDSVPVDELDQDFANAYMEELEESDDGDIFDDEDQQMHTNILDEVQIRFNDFSAEVGSTVDADDATFSSATSTHKDNLENSDDSSCSLFRAASFNEKGTCKDSDIDAGKMRSIGTGDSPSSLVLPLSQGNGEMMSKQDRVYIDENCTKQNPVSEYERNRYVAIQQACDRASLVAYQLVGHVLAGFGQLEVLDLDLENESYLRSEFLRPENAKVSNFEDRDVIGSIIVQAVHDVIPSFPSSQLELVRRFMNS